MELPELLAPAGDISKAYTAFRYGADAIYCGIAMFSLRTRENKFTENNIEEIIEFAKNNNKKVYVTVNAFPHENLIKALIKHLKFLEKVKPDGVIFADVGVLSLANEYAPSVPKHLSVQTSTMNTPAIKLWESLGVCRIICAREMSSSELKKIHEALPDMELEIFVHGAVCMSYSGRCLMSNFTGGRDANRGVCNHTCRWNYRVFDEEMREVDVADHFYPGAKPGCNSTAAKNIRDFEKQNFIEEQERQGEIVPVEEDFHGTHIMSSRDMCLIEQLQEIIDAGVCSLKIEGRNKTPYYLATVVRAYRRALDDIAADKPFDPTLWDEVHATANRGFFPGFFNGKPQKGDIQYEANRSASVKEFCGVVEKWANGRAEILVKNRIEEGSEVEFVMPTIEKDFVITATNLQFGDKKVDILHGGNTNNPSSIECKTKVPVGTFIRQKTLQ